MARGELVGDAYVRIHADTDPMRRALRRAAQQAGKENATEYEKSFSKQVDATADRVFKRNQQRIADALAVGTFDDLKKEFGSLENTLKHVRAEFNALHKEGRITKDELDDFRLSLNKWARTVRVAEKTKETTDALKAQQKIIDDQNAAWLTYGRNVKFAADKAQKAVDDQNAAWVTYGRNLNAAAAKQKEVDRDTNRFSRSVERLHTTFTKLGRSVGKAFGKGSRNDAVNFFGSIVGGLASLPALLPGTIGLVSKAVTNLVGQFKGVDFSGLGSALAGLAPILTNVYVALAVLAAAALAFAVALPAMVSGLTLLAGAAIAAAGAISVGLVGALAPLLPLLLALAPAMAVVIGYMQDFGKSAKQQPKYVKDIKTAWEHVSSAMTEAKKSLGTAIADVAPALANFWNPLIKGTGVAMAAIVKDFGEMMRDPQIAAFLKIWQVQLPKILQSVGFGINSLLGALTAFFTPILPFARLLADSFANMMLRFEEWASSAAGQNAIADFMEIAFTAAEALWDILVNLGRAIGSLFLSGTTGGGQSFLDYLVRVTDQFADWLGSAEGKNAVKKFFDDVKSAMVTMKDVLEKVVSGFDRLDTEQGRKDFQSFLDVINFMADSFIRLADVMPVIVGIAKVILAPFLGMIKLIMAVPGAFETAKSAIGDALTAIGGFFTGLWTTISEFFTGVIGGIASFATSLWEGITGALSQLVTIAGNILEQVAQVFLTVLLFIPALIVEIIGPQTIQSWISVLTGWVSTVTTWVTALYNVVKNWIVGIATGVGQWLAGVVGVIVTVWSAVQSAAITWWTNVYNTVKNKVVGIATSIYGWISPIIASIASAFSAAWQKVSKWVSDIYNTVKEKATSIASSIGGWIGDIASKFAAPFSAAYTEVKTWVDKITGLFGGALERASQAAAKIASILPGGSAASGAIVAGPTRILAGEAGMEAIVPLNRPLSLVDPAVRGLSAIAQGKTAFGTGGVVGGGRNITVASGAITVNTPSANPEHVAMSVLDRLTAAAY